MLSEREYFIALVDNDRIVQSDAIVLLEGDGLHRASHAAELLHRRLATRIIFSGGVDSRDKGSWPADVVLPELKRLGVPLSVVTVESESMNTRDQAVNVLELAQRERWQSFILVASHYHQYRAYLTFLQVRATMGLSCMILNSPARELSWYDHNPWGDRFSLLGEEFSKIDQYAELGHIATYAQAIEHQREKELWISSKPLG